MRIRRERIGDDSVYTRSRQRVPTDPRTYDDHCKQLQSHLDRIGRDMGWRARKVIPTQPGMRPIIKEA
jgi:hypothetical protein